MDPEEKQFASTRKSGQSKSLQKLITKATYEKVSEKLKPNEAAEKFKEKAKDSGLKQKNKSQASLKRSKFDTPEKNSSPKLNRSKNKTTIASTPNIPDLHGQVPFPFNLKIVPKAQITELIKTSKSKPSKHINPILLTPVLVNRKQGKEIEKSIAIETPKSEIKAIRFPIEKKEKKEKIVKKEQANIIKISEIVENVKTDPPENTPESNKLFFYNKFTQPSFGGGESEVPTIHEEEDPVFLSERHSYECESNQSLKFYAEKHDQFRKSAFKPESSEFYESLHSSFAQESEKNDIETQTEENQLAEMLKCLSHNEVKLGIKFISQIAQFMQTFK